MRAANVCVVAISLFASGACGADSGGYAGPKTVELAIDLPMSGGELAASQPIVEGVELALKEAGSKAGVITVLAPVVYDDTLNGSHDPATGAANVSKALAKADVIALIGPLNSAVARDQIPVSNAGGLFQCSPANTNPSLTKPDLGAGDLRPKPQAPNYVRVVTTDDVQGPAAARYVHDTLQATSVYVIDDGEGYGVDLADAFAAELAKEGGTVVKRDSAPANEDQAPDYAALLTAAAALHPQAIFFGGVTSTGAPEVLMAAHDAGLDVPFVGGDGILDGPGDVDGSFLSAANAEAQDAHATIAGPTEYPGRADFEARFRAEYGHAPGPYAPMGYACAQVFLDALARAQAADATDLAGLREAVRAAGVDPSHSYDTLLGTLHFDANGDTSQQIISFFHADPAAASGKGDWVFEKQIDFGAASP